MRPFIEAIWTHRWTTIKYIIAQVAALVLALHTTGATFSPAALLVGILPIITAPQAHVGVNIEVCILAVSGGLLGGLLAAFALTVARYQQPLLLLFIFVFIFALTLIRARWQRLTPVAISAGISIAASTLGGYQSDTVRFMPAIYAFFVGGSLSLSVSLLVRPTSARHAVIAAASHTLGQLVAHLETSMALLLDPLDEPGASRAPLPGDTKLLVEPPTFQVQSLPMNPAMVETFFATLIRSLLVLFPCLRSIRAPRFCLTRAARSVMVLTLIASSGSPNAIVWLKDRQASACEQYGALLDDLRNLARPLMVVSHATMRKCVCALSPKRTAESLTALTESDRRQLCAALNTFDEAVDSFVSRAVRPDRDALDRLNSVYDLVFLIRRIAGETLSLLDALLEPPLVLPYFCCHPSHCSSSSSAFSTSNTNTNFDTTTATTTSQSASLHHPNQRDPLRSWVQLFDLLSDGDDPHELDKKLDTAPTPSPSSSTTPHHRRSSVRLTTAERARLAQGVHAAHPNSATVAPGAGRASSSSVGDHEPLMTMMTQSMSRSTSALSLLPVDELPSVVTDWDAITELEEDLVNGVYNAQLPVMMGSGGSSSSPHAPLTVSCRLRLWHLLQFARRVEVIYAFKVSLVVLLVAYGTLQLVDQQHDWARTGGFYTLLAIMVLAQPFFGQMMLVSLLHGLAVPLGCLWAFATISAFPNGTVPIFTVMALLILIPCAHLKTIVAPWLKSFFHVIQLTTVIIITSYNDCHNLTQDTDCLSARSLTLLQLGGAELAIVCVLCASRLLFPYLARVELRLLAGRVVYSFALRYSAVITLFIAGASRSHSHRHHFRASRQEVAVLEAIARMRVLLEAARREPRLKGPFNSDVYAELIDVLYHMWGHLLRIRFAVERGLEASRVDVAASHRHSVWTGSQMVVRRRELVETVYQLLYMVAGSLSTKTPLPYSMPDVLHKSAALRDCHERILCDHGCRPSLTGSTGAQGVLYFSSYAWQSQQFIALLADVWTLASRLHGTTDRLSRAFRLYSYKLQHMERQLEEESRATHSQPFTVGGGDDSRSVLSSTIVDESAAEGGSAIDFESSV